MKALTIIQPWASAIACEAKRIETRSWSTAYRGPLLIHAGKSRDAIHRLGARQRMGDVSFPHAPFGAANYDELWHIFARLPFGALIAVAELVACLPIKTSVVNRRPFLARTDADGKPDNRLVDRAELPLGNFAPGRYGWVLANVRALPTPIPYCGRQGLFDVPDEVVAQCGLGGGK